jgi:hypothetical protein
METRHCNNLGEFKAVIDQYGRGVLYRGQTSHYAGSGDAPSLSTSFQRQGCIPDLMIKWSYYAKKALQHLVRGWKNSNDIATNQAILQHYGFRSFFLDASGDPRVAAWFASNSFESKVAVDLVEDCFEDPVLLRTLNAWFVPANRMGHIYLICQKALRHSGIQAVHLSEIATHEGTPRYVRQDAYMVGPLMQGGLSGDCILCHVTAPADVLRDFAGEYSTSWLFPGPSDDPVYRELLAMPWEKMRHIPDGGLEAFRRALELPEYSYNLRKHMPPESAMYRPFWTKDLPSPSGYQTATGTQIYQILCGSSLYYGVSAPRVALLYIEKLLLECSEISIELDGLVCHGMGTRYGKGVGIVKITKDIVCVFEYGVEHPGLRILGVGRFYGMHYRINRNGEWERVPHEDDCPCGSEHAENLEVLARIDRSLEDGDLECFETGLYVQKGVTPTSDLRATWGEPYF